MADTWTIVVVDHRPKPWPPAKTLILVGVSPCQVAEYVGIRRRMSPLGLKFRYNQPDLRN